MQFDEEKFVYQVIEKEAADEDNQVSHSQLETFSYRLENDPETPYANHKDEDLEFTDSEDESDDSLEVFIADESIERVVTPAQRDSTSI